MSAFSGQGASDRVSHPEKWLITISGILLPLALHCFPIKSPRLVSKSRFLSLCHSKFLVHYVSCKNPELYWSAMLNHLRLFPWYAKLVVPRMETLTFLLQNRVTISCSLHLCKNPQITIQSLEGLFFGCQKSFWRSGGNYLWKYKRMSHVWEKYSEKKKKKKLNYSIHRKIILGMQ